MTAAKLQGLLWKWRQPAFTAWCWCRQRVARRTGVHMCSSLGSRRLAAPARQRSYMLVVCTFPSGIPDPPMATRTLSCILHAQASCIFPDMPICYILSASYLFLFHHQGCWATASEICCQRRLCERQTESGGLNGRPEKLQDVCYSWWCLSALSILGRLSWIDQQALADFILNCQVWPLPSCSSCPAVPWGEVHV